MRKILKILVIFIAVSFFWAAFLPIVRTPYMLSENLRLERLKYDWQQLNRLPDMAVSMAIASEDAGFCAHSGVEWELLYRLARQGGQRGGSTITQQVVKNLWLWHGKSRASKILRKAIEVPIAAVFDIFIAKRRQMELYLNIIEFDTGVFGFEAAAWHHYQKGPLDLDLDEIARLIAVLPNPQGYQAVPPDPNVRERARKIKEGAGDVRTRGLDDCVLG